MIRYLFEAFFCKIREPDAFKGVDTFEKLRKVLELVETTPLPEGVDFLVFWKQRITECIKLLETDPLQWCPRHHDPAFYNTSEMYRSIEKKLLERD